jgi:quaternary ammonium compound-resistance protein SugE
MRWIVLALSAVAEAVWATALGEASWVVFAVALAASMAGLGYAAGRIPMGTAYAVWTGIGAALTVGWAMVTGNEPVSALRLLCLAGIVGAVVGLKLLPHHEPTRTDVSDSGTF